MKSMMTKIPRRLSSSAVSLPIEIAFFLNETAEIKYHFKVLPMPVFPPVMTATLPSSRTVFVQRGP